MRGPLHETPIPPSLPAVFSADRGAWRDEGSGAPTPGEILGDAGKVLGATLAAVLVIDALVMLLR